LTIGTQWAMSRCLYNKVGFQWGFFVSGGSQNKYVTRWRSNQVTAVRAANARWHPTAITCTRDDAAPTWPLFAMLSLYLVGLGMSPTLQNNSQCLTTKKCFQSTIVVTYTSSFWFWTDNLLCFEGTFYQKLATQQQVNECSSCSGQDKCSVSKASQKTFGLSLGALFCLKWLQNIGDSLKTNIRPQRTIFRPHQSNFVCSTSWPEKWDQLDPK
jgi:hypothetical protein